MIDRQTIKAFYVAGLSVRTSNSLEASPHGKIPVVWQQLFEMSIGQSIPNKVSDDIYAVYTDYESDHTGDYTYVLGYCVPSIEDLAKRYTIAEVPGGEYAVIASDTGPVRQIVPGIWQKIWAMTPDELQGTRAYRADFELYDRRAQNPSAAQIDVFVGLKH